MRDSKSSYGERVSRDLEVGCQVDEVWGATQWEKTKQGEPTSGRRGASGLL